MKLSARIFIVYFLLVGIGLYTFFSEVEKQLKPVMRQAMEGVMVDVANLLAELAAAEMSSGQISSGQFSLALQAFSQRQLSANIWGFDKKTPDLVVYITDVTGKVLFHTNSPQIGADYSQWLDVSRTLRGEYGARTTRVNEQDEFSSVMYVAAPILVKGDRVGVLTVGQPISGLTPFMALARTHLLWKGGLILALALAAGAVFSFWITRSIRQLVHYVQAVSRGERVSMPDISEAELAVLARSTEKMRQDLDGKYYVEQYVHTLTHEMKSPIAAVRAASELLLEGNMSAGDQQKFLHNIHGAAYRMQEFVDRLLALASIENIRHLSDRDCVDVTALLDQEINNTHAKCQGKPVSIELACSQTLPTIRASDFLLRQAVSNMLDNAIDFAEPGSVIRVVAQCDPAWLLIAVENEGPWIPDYAMPRIFDRFYSLPRPQGRDKSSGLGLNFVQEIAALHQGSVRVTNEGSLTAPRVRALLRIALVMAT